VDTLGPDLEDTVAAELVRLQRAAYAVEAALIGDDRIPPLHEGPADLRAARLRWFVVREAAGLVAARLGCGIRRRPDAREGAQRARRTGRQRGRRCSARLRARGLTDTSLEGTGAAAVSRLA